MQMLLDSFRAWSCGVAADGGQLATLCSCFLVLVALGVASAGPADSATAGAAAAAPFAGKVSQWHGFRRFDFALDGRKCIVVVPEQPAPSKPWVWRARFFGHQPQVDIALLKRGFHLVYMDVGGLFGAPKAVAHWSAFYEFLTSKHGFAPKVALEGMSRGGLAIYNWAAANPDKVACIYGDAPVCDIRSWPGGKGKGKGHAGTWQACLRVYGLTEESAAAFKGNPIDHLAPLAAARIPILHVCGAADDVVPMVENSDVLAARYRELGGRIEVIAKPGCGHHPHCLKDPKPIVDFMLEHTIGSGVEAVPYTTPGSALRNCRTVFEREKRGRVAFLGGSITEMNGYRPHVCNTLTERFPQTEFDFINAGISSTCSTTGAFRLATDVLHRGRVDLLFVEFAVNDNQDAHHTGPECIRGMEGIVRQARRTNPAMDIVFLYCANEHHIRLLKQGETPLEIAHHAQVAEHYRLPTVHFAQEVAASIAAGSFDWRKFGGCHPSPFGNALYGKRIAALMDACWAAAAPADAAAPAYAMPPAPLDSQHYGWGAFLDLAQQPIAEGWQLGVPDWKALPGSKRARFLGIPLLHTARLGAAQQIRFTGTAVGLYVVAGPDAGAVEYAIDDGPTQTVELFHHFSRGLHYPRTCMLAVGLDNREHTLSLQAAPSSNAKSKGAAVRIVQVVVNGPELGAK